jgi:quinol monooxygenase YgiN
MPIFQSGAYKVKPEAVERVKKAIAEFVDYVKVNEPGTEMYLSWQEKDDPTKFIHHFIFRDEASQKLHGESDAVRKFESVYSPELVSKGVTFTDFNMPAGKREKP